MTGAENEFADQPAFFEGIKFFAEILKKRNYEHSRGMQFIFSTLLKK